MAGAPEDARRKGPELAELSATGTADSNQHFIGPRRRWVFWMATFCLGPLGLGAWDLLTPDRHFGWLLALVLFLFESLGLLVFLDMAFRPFKYGLDVPPAKFEYRDGNRRRTFAWNEVSEFRVETHVSLQGWPLFRFKQRFVAFDVIDQSGDPIFVPKSFGPFKFKMSRSHSLPSFLDADPTDLCRFLNEYRMVAVDGSRNG